MSIANRAEPIDLSILVTTFRQPRHLALVLESIALQRAPGVRFEVVVSDDGSDDGTDEVVRRFGASAAFPVSFLTRPRDGSCRARVRNDAAREARGEYLLFLDGDCMVPPHHVAAHAARRRAGMALIGYCARLPEDASAGLVPAALRTADFRRLAPPDELRRVARRHRRAWWHNLMRHPTKPRLASGDFGVWRDDFTRVNGFDERFRGWGQEDDDLGLRLRAAGVRLESILDRTCSLHVWHPTDPAATRRWRDGDNVSYFERRGRLMACRRGLARRTNGAVAWGLPADIGSTALGRALDRALAGAARSAPGAACEIDVIVVPGVCGFTRPAECRLALVAEGTSPPIARLCDQVIEVTADDVAVAAALESAG